MEPVQPDVEYQKESKLDTQNLDDLAEDVIKQSLTSLMLPRLEKGLRQATAAGEYRITHRAAGKGRYQPEFHRPHARWRRRCR